jgi:hypothetical protein
VQHAVDRLAARALHCQHQWRKLFAMGEVVGHAEGVDAGPQGGRVGDAGDAFTVDEDARLVTAQGFRVFGGSHWHGRIPGVGDTALCKPPIRAALGGKSRQARAGDHR